MGNELRRLKQDLSNSPEKREMILKAMMEPTIKGLVDAAKSSGYDITETDVRKAVTLPMQQDEISSSFVLVTQILVA